jgi:hypothetical protein
MQKLMTRIIKDETLGHVPYRYNKRLHTRKSKETEMHYVITHIQEEVEKRKLYLIIPTY